MIEERKQLIGDAPPPRRRGGLRRAAPLVIAGVIFALMLLIVLFNIEPPREAPAQNDPERFGEITELLDDDSPAPLPPGGDEPIGVEQIIGPQSGAWVQMQGADGRVEQQYRFAQLNPNPPGLGKGWMQMHKPRAEFYLSGDRALTMRAESALANAPNQALEGGTMSGNVIIRLYEDIVDRPTPFDHRTPTLVVRTNKATFDNITGDIRCEGDVDIQTEAAHIPGHNLRMQINDADGRLESLRMASVGTIRLISPEDAESSTATPDTIEPQPPVVAATTPTPSPEVDAAPARPMDAAPTDKPARPEKPRAAGDFYVLTLRDGVEIEQPHDTGRRVATGDELRVTFSLKGEGVSLAQHDHRAAVSNHTALAPRLSAYTAVRMYAFGALQPTSPDDLFRPGPDDTITFVRCRGGITMMPAADPADQLDSADEVRLELLGAPVVMREAGENLEARCARLSLLRLNERITLHSDNTQRVTITSPELDGEGDTFFYDRQRSVAGFIGAGWLAPKRTGDDDSMPQDLRIAWTDRVDFGLDERRAGATNRQPVLRHANFHGDVAVESGEGDIMAQHLELELAVDESGRSTPRRMVATDQVMARDTEMAFWGDHLDVEFLVNEPVPAGSAIFGGDDSIKAIRADGGVQIALADGSRVIADTMNGTAETGDMVLTGRPVNILTDRLVFQTQRPLNIEKRDATGRIHSTGPGRCLLMSETTPVDVARRLNAADLATRLRPDFEILELTIAWQDRIELHVQDVAGRDDPALTAALFKGEVDIVGRDGVMRAQDLAMQLRVDDQGQSQPRLMTASGDVFVRDEQLRFWADQLIVHFADDPEAAAREQSAGAPEAIFGSTTEIERLEAEGDVQVLLANGTRTWSQQLTGESATQTVELTSTDQVVIATGRVLLDGVPHYTLRKTTGSLHGAGAGRARIFASAQPRLDNQRIAMPFTDTTAPDPQVDARWSQAIEITDDQATQTAAIDLLGNVEVVSEREAHQRDTMSGETLRLEFVASDVRRAARPMDSPGSGTNVDPFTAEGDRQLKRMVAAGDARMESRVWHSAERLDTPRVYYVTGPEVIYDNLTQDAEVNGGGEMIIRDLRPAEDQNEPGVMTPFTARGTSRIRWADQFTMRHIFDDRYEVRLRGGVEVVHLDLNDQSSTLTGDQLTIWLQRDAGAQSMPGDAPTDALAFGGSMTVRRLRGQGNLYITTPTREVSCDTFAYDRYTEVAELGSFPNGQVSIKTVGTDYPIFAQRIIWNLRTDAVTVDQAAGAGAP